jgi:lactoylglutathione lyase
MDRDRNMPALVQHLALECESVDTLLATKQRLEAAGIEVLGPTDHLLLRPERPTAWNLRPTPAPRR